MPIKRGQPTFRQLEYLLALDELRHFRRAAEKLGVSQPSLSMQLNVLEDALGVSLAERGRSGVTLTPIGREVAARGRRILIAVQEICDLAVSAGSQHGLLGTIRLGTSPTLGPYILPQIVKRLHRGYPDLTLYVREGAPRDLQSDLLGGKHDIVLSPLPIVSNDLTVTRLFLEPLYLVVASDHVLAMKTKVSVSDLADLKVLAPAPHYHLYDQVKAICDDAGAELLRDYEGTSLDTLRHMVGMGLGVSLLPSLYVQSEIKARGEVRAIPFKGQKVTRPIGIAWRRGSGIVRGFSNIASEIRSVASAQFDDLRLI